MTRKWITNNGELERVPGTENDKLTLGEQMILQPELNLMNTVQKLLKAVNSIFDNDNQ